MEPSAGDVTRLLRELRRGTPDAESKLAPLVYGHLHRLAARCMRRERPDHTLQPTALVNEAYLRLVSQNETTWRDRAHFFGVAARLMRQILVDHARARQAGKRGGPAEKLPLDQALEFSPAKSRELVELDDALRSLERLDPQAEPDCRAALFWRPDGGRDSRGTWHLAAPARCSQTLPFPCSSARPSILTTGDALPPW